MRAQVEEQNGSLCLRATSGRSPPQPTQRPFGCPGGFAFIGCCSSTRHEPTVGRRDRHGAVVIYGPAGTGLSTDCARCPQQLFLLSGRPEEDSRLHQPIRLLLRGPQGSSLKPSRQPQRHGDRSNDDVAIAGVKIHNEAGEAYCSDRVAEVTGASRTPGRLQRRPALFSQEQQLGATDGRAAFQNV
jgi:hypothetical protein